MLELGMISSMVSVFLSFSWTSRLSKPSGSTCGFSCLLPVRAPEMCGLLPHSTDHPGRCWVRSFTLLLWIRQNTHIATTLILEQKHKGALQLVEITKDHQSRRFLLVFLSNQEFCPGLKLKRFWSIQGWGFPLRSNRKTRFWEQWMCTTSSISVL